MPAQVYRYRFARTVRFQDVMATLALAVVATESLHGRSQAKLDARFGENANTRAIAIDGSTPIGRALNALFVGFARREFGETTFTIERLSQSLSRNTA